MRSQQSVSQEIEPELFARLEEVFSPGDVVLTVARSMPNRIVSIAADAILVATERSQARDRAEPVPGWMFNVAWRELQEKGRLTERDLVTVVKRSAAVCAILAALPEVEVVSRSPIELGLRKGTVPIPQKLLDAYRATQVSVEIDGVWRDEQQAVELLGGRVFVITAWNPESSELTRAENDRRHQALSDAVGAMELESHRAAGASADGSWTEVSLAIVGIEEDAARRLGSRFGQLAVFEVTSAGTRVVPCAGPSRSMPSRATDAFYVYENWTNTFAKVHRGSCSSCNHGMGMHGKGRRTPSGEWHGPIASAAEAVAEARRLADQHSNHDVWVVDTCAVCAPA